MTICKTIQFFTHFRLYVVAVVLLVLSTSVFSCLSLPNSKADLTDQKMSFLNSVKTSTVQTSKELIFVSDFNENKKLNVSYFSKPTHNKANSKSGDSINPYHTDSQPIESENDAEIDDDLGDEDFIKSHLSNINYKTLKNKHNHNYLSSICLNNFNTLVWRPPQV